MKGGKLTEKQERFYDAALAFRDLKLWKKMEDDQLFAVAAKDQILYVNIQGMLGEHHALAVYPGQEGMDRLWRIFQTEEESEDEQIAAAIGQLSLHCEFVPGKELDQRAAEMLAVYTEARGIHMNRGNRELWPQLLQVRPYRVATYPYGEAETETMTEALEAACWLNRNLGRPMNFLAHLFEIGESMPLLHREGEGWRIEYIPLPTEPDYSYPIGHTMNEMYEARVRKLRKEGIWACKLRLDPIPRPAEGMEEMVIPWELLTVDLDTGREIQIQKVRDYETRTEVMLDKIMEAMFRERICPGAFCVYDERTYSLLEEWSAKMRIGLSREDEDEIPEEIEEMIDFRDAEALMAEDQTGESMAEMLDFMLMLPDQELFSVPGTRENIESFREMLDTPELPKAVRDRIVRIVKRYDDYQKRMGQKSSSGRGKGKKKSGPEKTLVISVSLGTGCYRHIQISDQAMLEDLSLAILEAFAFDNDHAHAFFMDNRTYSPYDAYYVRGFDDEGPATDEVTLAEAGLRAEKKFKYLFDFGDDWTFQCKVLKETDEKTPRAQVVRSKGQAPEQYPIWDDDDDDDDDWDPEE